MASETIVVTVPGTTANLGPGFDCLGVALSLANQVTVSRGRLRGALPLDGMVGETVEAYFALIRKRWDVSVAVRGVVPRSRGMGSSVTVRGGIIWGLNELCGRPLSRGECLAAVAWLEGHPDNAAPAFLGGFTACTGRSMVRVPVSSRLKFVAAIPDFEVETEKARGVLPESVTFGAAVESARHAALVTAAFCSGQYERLAGAFRDGLHQPYRRALIPMMDEVIRAGEGAGALGGFLSGSGSTIMCVALGEEVAQGTARAMGRAFRATGVKAKTLVLTADNAGIRS